MNATPRRAPRAKKSPEALARARETRRNNQAFSFRDPADGERFYELLRDADAHHCEATKLRKAAWALYHAEADRKRQLARDVRELLS